MNAPAPTSTPASIHVGGDLTGKIIIGDNNFCVDANYGVIVYRPAAPRVRQRNFAPAPLRKPRGFVGRLAELERVRHLIAERGAGVIVGAEGVGKSALLQRAAGDPAAGQLPHGVVAIDAIDADGAALGFDDIVQRVFDELFESDPPLKVTESTARPYLSNTSPLLVLDGFRFGPEQIKRLVNLFPQGALLLSAPETSGASEWVEHLNLAPLPRAEARQLLAARLGAACDDDLDSIAAALGDVPAALVLVANVARLQALPCARVREKLAAYQPASSDRLQAGLEHAYALARAALTEAERETLAAIAAAPGISVDPAYLRQALPASVAIETALERLLALGLLEAAHPRARLHPAFRAFARPPDSSRQRAALLAFLRQGLHQPQFCADELGNILGMIDWAAGQRRWDDVIALGRAIDPHLTQRGLWDAWRAVLERVWLAARSANVAAVEAWALHQLGTRELGLGQTTQAIEYLQRALALRRELGDATAVHYTQHNLDLILPPTLPPESGSSPPPTPPSGAGALGVTWLLGSLAIVLAVAAGWLVLYSLDLLPRVEAASTPPPPLVSPPPTFDESAFRTRLAPTIFPPSPTTTPTGTPSVTGTWTATPSATATPTGTPSPTASVPILGGHVVQPGETLFCIGRAYGVDPKAIAQANPGVSTGLRVGQRLNIPDVRWSPVPAGLVCRAQFASPYAPTPTWTPTITPTVTWTPTRPTNYAPVVQIAKPKTDVAYGDPAYKYSDKEYDARRQRYYKDVALSAYASDVEDGLLSGSALVWTTDFWYGKNVVVGSGMNIVVRLYDGCGGEQYTLTVTATDRQGNVATARRSITIWGIGCID